MDDNSSWFKGFDLDSIQNSIRQSVDEASKFVDINLDDFNLDNLQDDDEKDDEKLSRSDIASRDDTNSSALSFYQQDTDMLHIPKERTDNPVNKKKTEPSSLWSVDPSLGSPNVTPQKFNFDDSLTTNDSLQPNLVGNKSVSIQSPPNSLGLPHSTSNHDKIAHLIDSESLSDTAPGDDDIGSRSLWSELSEGILISTPHGTEREFGEDSSSQSGVTASDKIHKNTHIASWEETLAASSGTNRVALAKKSTPKLSFFFDDDNDPEAARNELSNDPIYQRVNLNKTSGSQAYSLSSLSSDINFSSVAPDVVGRVSSLLSNGSSSLASSSSSFMSSVSSTAASLFFSSTDHQVISQPASGTASTHAGATLRHHPTSYGASVLPAYSESPRRPGGDSSHRSSSSGPLAPSLGRSSENTSVSTMTRLQQCLHRANSQVIWDIAISNNSIAVLTILLFLYSYWKFRRYGTDAGD